MSALYDAFAWLANGLTEHASVEVTYTRDVDSVTINAIPGRPQVDRAEVAGKSRVKIDEEWVDFHIKPSLIDFGSGAVEPARGDTITIGSVVREVMPMNNEPLWRRSDVSGNLYAVRTHRTA